MENISYSGIAKTTSYLAALLLGLCIALATASFAAPSASADEKAGSASSVREWGASLAGQFERPPLGVRPQTYWWIPEPEMMTVAGIERDVDAIADAGIASFLPFRRDFAAPVQHAHLQLLEAALEAAMRRGIKLDLSLAETATAPTVTADSPAAAQELVYGQATVGSGQTFDGALPAPPTRPEQPRTLVAVVAARCSAGCATAKPVLLEESSLIDLTESVSNEEIEWSPPATGDDWVLLSFWSRNGLFCDRRDCPSPVPYADHLSARGAQAITDYLDEHTMTPKIRSLLADAGGVLHENSLHLGGYHLWSADFLDEFRDRRGYSLRRYLPVSIIGNLNEFFVPDPFGTQKSPDSAADFDFAGDDGRRIRNDYYHTLSELWEEEYVGTLQRWANSHGLEFQAKVAYGQTFSTSSAARIDLPMTEAFQLGDSLDAYRSMAGAVHMGDRQIFAAECCPAATGYRRDNYSTTWKQMLAVIRNLFASGVNQIRLHGVTYPDAPEASWPGRNEYTRVAQPGHGEEFGPRMPYWHNMPDLTDTIGREQLILRRGVPQVDVAVYRQSFWDYGFHMATTGVPVPQCTVPPGCDLLNDKSLQRAGFSYEFVGPALFELPGAEVRKRRLDPAGPAYKALVLNPGQRTAVDGMPLAAAREVLNFARRGLPIVVVGELPTETGFFADSGDDASVRRTLAMLLEQPNVRQVDAEGEIVEALRQLDVDAAARPQIPSNLLSVHRRDGAADYYFLWNQSRVSKVTNLPEPTPEPFDQEVSFEGGGRPFVLDSWTGEVGPIGAYESRHGRVVTQIKLAPGEATIVAIGPKSWQRRELAINSLDRLPHATATTADEVVVGSDRELRIRSSIPGTYTTWLNNHRVLRSKIGPLPAPVAPSSWDLSVEDWQPGASTNETLKVPHELKLDSLRPWPQIESLADVSGIGRYTTEIELSPNWIGPNHGATLDLGPLFDSTRLTVNGHPVGYVDPNQPVVDVSRYLVAGVNKIEVEVSTTLRNRLRTIFPGWSAFPREPYGLVGPVTLVPFGEAVVVRGRKGGGR